MKYAVFAILVPLSAAALVALPGCRKTPPVNVAAKGKTNATQTDQLKSALDLLRQASEPAQYRDALQLLNAHLAKGTGKPMKPLSPEEKESLRALYRLDPDEMAEVEANVFQPLDAYHLQNASLFRDAALQVELPVEHPDLVGLEQACLCFDWTMRRVQLHEQADEGLPPAFVVRRGYGSGLDRALVFLELLHQFQIEGCLLAPSDHPDHQTPLLVGVPFAAGPRWEGGLYLFDPKGGRSVTKSEPATATAWKVRADIATLANVRANPDLLKSTSLSADLAPKLALYHVAPLPALSARMRYLQELLLFQDKIILFQDALKLRRDLSKVAEPEAQVWPPPTSGKGPSPTRALRMFVSSDNGGIDKTGRLARFQYQQIPWPLLKQQLQEMRLLQTEEIPKQAQDVLIQYLGRLFTLYALEPREHFLHGHLEAALKRLDRMRTVLESEEDARPLEDDVFQRRLGDWRGLVRSAYVSLLVNKEANGQARVNSLWNEDQYLLNLLQVEGEEIPLNRFEKKFLSMIVLTAAREPLGQQVNYLIASCQHEKAAKLQASADFLVASGKDAANVKVDADFAWRNARGAWNKYLDRYQFSAQSLPKRLAEIQQRAGRNDVEGAVGLWEQLHQDIHSTIEATLRLAEAQGHLQATRPALEQLSAELDRLNKSDVASALNAYLEKMRGNPPAAQRLQLLSRDWGPQGNIAWSKR